MELTREQLYEMLWSDGVGKTEKALGLKRQELKKICEEFQIPRPSSQYWTAFKLGQSPQKTPLPAAEENKPIHTEVYVKPPRVKKEKPAPEPKKTPEGKYEPRELPEEEPTTIYSVPEKLYAKDPVILDTKQRLRNVPAPTISGNGMRTRGADTARGKCSSSSPPRSSRACGSPRARGCTCSERCRKAPPCPRVQAPSR